MRQLAISEIYTKHPLLSIGYKPLHLNLTDSCENTWTKVQVLKVGNNKYRVELVQPSLQQFPISLNNMHSDATTEMVVLNV